MVTVFTLHLFGAIPNAGRHVEFTIESNPWKDLYRPALGSPRRPGGDSRRAGLGRDDQPRVAGQGGTPGKYAAMMSLFSGVLRA